MKRKMIAMLVAMLLLSGCGGNEKDEGKEQIDSSVSSLMDKKQVDQTDIAKQEETAFPGSYTVPDGWIKSDEYSTEEKIFYFEEGHEQDEFPDNISINVGTNQYSLENHTEFRNAIVQQLLMQLDGVDAQLNGDGTYTEQGYVLYIFTIDDGDAVTKQYYIVKDYGFCLVHLTNFTGSESTYGAAQTIVDSFVWKSED